MIQGRGNKGKCLLLCFLNITQESQTVQSVWNTPGFDDLGESIEKRNLGQWYP